MKISISYQEAARMLGSKTGLDVKLIYCGNSSRIKTELYGISLFIKVESVSDGVIVISHQIGHDLQHDGFVNFLKRSSQVMAQDAVNRLIEKKLKNPAVTVGDDQSVRVNLHEIEQLKNVLKSVDLKDISFDWNGIVVDASIKLEQQ